MGLKKTWTNRVYGSQPKVIQLRHPRDPSRITVPPGATSDTASFTASGVPAASSTSDGGASASAAWRSEGDSRTFQACRGGYGWPRMATDGRFVSSWAAGSLHFFGPRLKQFGAPKHSSGIWHGSSWARHHELPEEALPAPVAKSIPPRQLCSKCFGLLQPGGLRTHQAHPRHSFAHSEHFQQQQTCATPSTLAKAHQEGGHRHDSAMWHLIPQSLKQTTIYIYIDKLW